MQRDKFTYQVLKVYKIRGQALPELDDDIEFIVDEILRKISFPSGLCKFTDDEIEYVFNNGVYEKFCPVEYLSAAFIIKWFELFQTSGLKDKLFPKIMIEEKAQLTDDQKEQIVYQGLCDKFEFYKQTGTLRDPGGVSCRYLFNKGKISLSEKQVREYRGRAKETIMLSYEGQAKTKEILSVIKSIELGDCTEQKMEASRLALKDYFDKLIDLDKSIADIFKGE